MNPKYPLIAQAEFRKLYDQTRLFAVEILWKSWFHLLSTLALCACTIFFCGDERPSIPCPIGGVYCERVVVYALVHHVPRL